MKNKIIRLTENDIQNLVQKIIKESYSNQKLLLQVDNISEMLGHEDMVGAFSDLAEAADYLYNEMYDGNHGPIMTKEIEDLLTQIYEVIGWPDEDEDYMEDETRTPIKPITIYDETYEFVEDLPIRELGIGSYVVDNDNGIVLVNGDTPLQDWIDNVTGGMEGEED